MLFRTLDKSCRNYAHQLGMLYFGTGHSVSKQPLRLMSTDQSLTTILTAALLHATSCTGGLAAFRQVLANHSQQKSQRICKGGRKLPSHFPSKSFQRAQPM